LGNDTDPENSALTAVIVNSTTNGALTLNADGSFTYTPTANFNGTDTFTYKANDGTNLSSAATVTITVNPANDAPVANNDSYNATEDTTLTVNATLGALANDTDIDGDSLTAVLVSNPTHGTLTLSADGSFTYIPNADFNGTDSFTYRANDGVTNSGTATVTINIAPVNDAPVANNDSYSVQSDSALNISAPGVLANDTDVENDPLTAVLATQPGHGAVTLNSDGSFTYTPAADYFGNDTFTYRANDGQLNSGVATVTISVIPNSISITNPPTDRTNCPGDSVTFSVGATGTALTYQWYFGGSVLSGETNNTLVLNSITAANGGQYCVVVNGASGGPLTNCAQLVVNVTTAVTNPPVSQTSASALLAQISLTNGASVTPS
jgi:large repetitive protein